MAEELRNKCRRISLRQISAELATRSFVTPRGLAYSAPAVRSMLGSAGPEAALAVRRSLRGIRRLGHARIRDVPHQPQRPS